MTFKLLWDLAEREGHRAGELPFTVFEPVGLQLDPELIRWDYYPTPLNSITFATTCGDGVHFGFVKLDGLPDGSEPIVMTLPATDYVESNLIVGENLHEFLCLGCQFGYFELEQLVYDREDTLARLERPDPPDAKADYLLSLLRTEFDLKPWTNFGERLDALNAKYLSLLDLNPFEAWD